MRHLPLLLLPLLAAAPLASAADGVTLELDRSVPSGDRWHQSLLSLAFTEVPRVRPPLLSATLETELVALLAFRHFFRHAYGVELDPTRLRSECDRLLGSSAQINADLDRFDTFIAAAIDEAARSPE